MKWFSFIALVAAATLPIQGCKIPPDQHIFQALTVPAARLLGIPTVPFVKSGQGSFSLKSVKSILVDTKYQASVNTEGETLIPPTLLAFAKTFSADLETSLGLKVPVVTGTSRTRNSIFITIGSNASEWLDAAGRQTSEGYSLDITSDGIVITGASSLGAWWATRSIIQQGALDTELSLGSGSDAPGWGIRGTFLDCGRHFYPKEFIVEMCSYLSFFKQNTLHMHLSDSVGVNDLISYEQKLELYSSFRFNSPIADLEGLNKRPNESYYEADFEYMQQSCASRGVTIIPEIEAPGHALVITQWKPELALSTDFSLLNISNPETIPTMKTIWGTFLPWIHSKTVHLGADEYTASVSDYTLYVNTMHDYILSNYNKAVRIWGTFAPSTEANTTNVNTNVSVQHWEFFEANPYFKFIKNGYNVLNSDDAFYVVNKWSGSYKQTLNITRIFHGAPDGGPYAPNIFDTSNATNNPARDNPYVLGHLPALWNDFGPNSSAVIEAYYALRPGLPALGDKQWGGDLLEEEYYDIFETLHAVIPGQNLDRTIASKTSTILSYDFTDFDSGAKSRKVSDKSGNGYDGLITSSCEVSNSVLTLKAGCEVSTPLSTKGKNYTLSFSIKPTSKTPGTLFSGPHSSLLIGNNTNPNVMLVTGGNAYSLNYTLPVNIWSDVSLIGIGNATYLSVTEAGGPEEVHEFTTTLGVLSNSFVWNNPMAIEAPLAKIGGDSFQGQLKSVVLKDGANEKYAAYVTPLVIGIAPYT